MTEYWFDAEAADQAVAFFERCLVHTVGEFAGVPFLLQPWQRDEIVRPLFGWKRRDHDDPAKCTRRYRRFRLWVPRKNGKTQISAGIGAYMTLADAEHDARIYSIAANTEQASLTYNAGLGMIGASPVLRDHYELLKSRIVYPGFNAVWEVLSGRARGKHGLNASCKLGDEIHEWIDNELNDTIRKSMAMRRQPLEFDTSTAGIVNSFGHREYEYDRKVRDGVLDDPDLLAVIYEAAAEDDWQDPKVWAKANPNLGVTVKEAFLASECRKALNNPAEENQFRMYHLNQWTQQAVRWLQMHLWAKCQTAEDGWRGMFERMLGRECLIGIDISSNKDVTAVVYVLPPSAADPLTHVACRFYIPADNIKERVKRDRVPFDRWVHEGACRATDGNAIDQEAIFGDIVEDSARFRVTRVGLDKWNTGWLGPKLVDHFGNDDKKKPKVVTVQQGYGSMSPGAKELERLVIAGLLDHGNHPVLKWMASNVAISVGKQGDIVPIKDKSADRIDGIVATIIALSCAVAEAIPTGPIRFQREGLLVI